MANISYVGEGRVYLIAGGGKCYSDIAARFCRSEKNVQEIIGTDDSLKALKAIVESGHQAALEFDDFIFGIEGYSRVTEVQLVRKRHASYNIKSGRVDKHGKRSFDVVIPRIIEANRHILSTKIKLDPKMIHFGIITDTSHVVEKDEKSKHNLNMFDFIDTYNTHMDGIEVDLDDIYLDVNDLFILDVIEQWYNHGVELNIKEEDLRYLKPQATEFKACIKMNISGLLDWFKVRLCNRAQAEIRDLATKIYRICVEEFPIVFENAGANCKCLGYCPEKEQCEQMKGKIPTKEEALKILKEYYK